MRLPFDVIGILFARVQPGGRGLNETMRTGPAKNQVQKPACEKNKQIQSTSRVSPLSSSVYTIEACTLRRLYSVHKPAHLTLSSAAASASIHRVSITKNNKELGVITNHRTTFRNSKEFPIFSHTKNGYLPALLVSAMGACLGWRNKSTGSVRAGINAMDTK